MKSRASAGVGIAVAFATILLGSAFVAAVLRTPGSHRDESSIGINAWTVAERGTDEHGVRWPVYFRAFGEWKNPVYIYALAGVFRITGPSMEAARLTSAGMIVLAALAAAWLGGRLGGGAGAAAGLLVSLSFPWWFDIGRLVFEAAVFPLASLLFLLGAHFVWKDRRSAAGACLVAAGLLALTYGYSTGRMLGPISAALVAALLVRVRGRWNGAAIAGLLGWAAGLVPLAWFVLRHPGALGKRFDLISNIPENPLFAPVILVWRMLVEINPFYWIRAGDHLDRHHLQGHAALTLAMAALALYGASRIVHAHRGDRWLLLVAAFTLLGVLPGVITVGIHHELRLATFAAGLVVLATFGAAELARTRGVGAVTVPIGLAVLQGLLYLGAAAGGAPDLENAFETDFQEAFAQAVADPRTEIWIVDGPLRPVQEAHARWWAAALRVPEARVRDGGSEAPPGSAPLTGASGEEYVNVRILRGAG